MIRSLRAWLLFGALVLGVTWAPGAARAGGASDFWYWFEYEHSKLADPAQAVDGRALLEYWLGRIDPALSYVLEMHKRRKTLVISADGEVTLFRTVQLMVEGAPKVKGWKFVALRPKQRPLTPVQVDSVMLDPATTFFDLYRDGGRIGVVFYLPEYVPDHMAAYRIAAMRLMSQAVSEWDVGLEVGFVDFDSQSVRDMQFSRPFADFKDVFAKLRE